MKDEILYGLELISHLMIASGMIMIDICGCIDWLKCIGREPVDNLQAFVETGLCMMTISATLYVIFRAFRLWAENQKEKY